MKMKKVYKKPIVIVESFQLNAAIASACSESEKVPLHHGFDTCTWEEELPNSGYFGDACNHDVKVEGDGNDMICYHGPIPADSVTMYS